MDHSGTAELDPAGAFARAAAFAFEYAGSVAFETREIELSRRLGEREVARAKTGYGFLTEQAFQPLGDCAFQVSHRDAFVDAEAFELMEHRRVRHVRSITA